MRLIDADALSEELSTLATTITGLRAGKGVLREYMTEYRKSVLRIVDEQPTVDAMPVPCKPMDTVYFIECRTDGNHKIRSGFALSVEYSVCYKPLVTIRYDDNTTDSTKHYLGLKAFMSREEAEAALAKMNRKDDT